MDWLEILGWGQQEIDDLRCMAYSYAKEGAYDASLSFFDTLMVVAPSTPYDLQTVGAIHLQLGNGLKALEYLDRALKVEEMNEEARLNRAKALFMLGYRRQGMLAAMELQKSEKDEIAKQASALLLSYQQ